MSLQQKLEYWSNYLPGYMQIRHPVFTARLISMITTKSSKSRAGGDASREGAGAGAGMTGVETGMTGAGAGMTGVGAGMAGTGTGMAASGSEEKSPQSYPAEKPERTNGIQAACYVAALKAG